MNSEEKWMTAGELMDRLRANPEYQQRMLKKQERRRERADRIKSDAEHLAADLREIGVDLTLEDMVNSPTKLPSKVVEILLDHLNRCQMNSNKEFIVRALAGVDETFDGRPLIKCYEETKDSEAVRWAILNTISLVRPNSVDEWIHQISQSPHVRETLIKLGYPLGRSK